MAILQSLSECQVNSLILPIFTIKLVAMAWTPANVCVCRRIVRTNDNMEDWHRRLNTLHVVVAWPSASCCNSFSTKGSSSRCRRGKLRRQRRRQYQDKLQTHWGTTLRPSNGKYRTTSILCTCRAACSGHDAENYAGRRHSEPDLLFSELEHK